MAQRISRGATPFDVGTSQYVIDGLPVNSSGFELTLGRQPAWDGLVGRMFTISIEIALDGVTYQPWISTALDGGPRIDRNGVPLAVFKLSGNWPGAAQGASRKVLRAVNLRATLDVAQAFTASSVLLETI